MRDVQKEILAFWFSAPATLRLLAESAGTECADAALMAPVAERFGRDVRLAHEGVFDAWAGQPDGALALCLLLGPMSRLVFWGQAQAYAGDARVLEIAQAALGRGDDRLLPVDRRGALYWPLTQSENMADQDRAVTLWVGLQGHDPVGYVRVVRGRDEIARFGRFCARDAVLGRGAG